MKIRFVLADPLPEDYHPVASLAYGPVYLMSCWLAAWLYFRRSGSGLRRRLLLISGGVLLAEWAAIFGETGKIRPPDIDVVLFSWWNSFFGPQLTLPLAVIITWLVVTCVATAVAVMRKRPLKGV